MATARKTAESKAETPETPEVVPAEQSTGKPVTPETPAFTPASSVVAPGGPAYATVPPQPTEDDLRIGVTPGVAPIPPVSATEPEAEPEHRIETYEATKPNGEKVTVEHNIDTGTTKIIG